MSDLRNPDDFLGRKASEPSNPLQRLFRWLFTNPAGQMMLLFLGVILTVYFTGGLSSGRARRESSEESGGDGEFEDW